MLLDEALELYNGRHPQARLAIAEPAPGELILELCGELEMKAASDLAPVLESALAACPSRGRLVLDLGQVGYVSSTGVGLLATTMVAAEGRMVSLVLRDLPPRVRTIMEGLGLLSFFSLEEACE